MKGMRDTTAQFTGGARTPVPVGSSPGRVEGRIPGPQGLSWDQLWAPLSSRSPIVLKHLTGMDRQGEMILGTYLYGEGKAHDVVDDPAWTAYMKKHEVLRGQILAQLVAIVEKLADRGKGRYPIAQTFHAQFPKINGFSGYALLHGTNATVGDFLLTGWADVQAADKPADGAFDIELALRFVFNDIVDPNGTYTMDRWRSIAAEIFTAGTAESYRLTISWGSDCFAEVRPGKPIELSGYPSDRPLWY